ncbi:adenosylmethionine--8-amino-7-oxononanoate transaminase [bacterium]|nr:adenosylmethionine--8-amino-7-oxononanoate transaminase [bacterium]
MKTNPSAQRRNASAQPSWAATGARHLWLPYNQHKLAPAPLPVVGAKDCRIHLADGRELVDGIANWWTACHGHAHPKLVEAVQKQAAALPHVMFGGLMHEPAALLAEKLTAIAPEGLNRVFFADSGSVAVETAMKMAVQYWVNKGKVNKKKIIAFRHGYHGDTMGCMSVCDPDDGMHTTFSGYVPMQFHIDIPSDEYGFSEFDDLLSHIAPSAAAIIIEPLVQGAGGMIFHSADTLAEIHRITQKHELLLIADEIATGFGRTGSMFACNEAGITPDIMCVGKALTGGMLTLAATLATDKVFDGFLSELPGRALMQGPTYMANPIACAAALASLELFESEPRIQQVQTIEQHLWQLLSPLRNVENVKDVRVKGAIGVVELDACAVDAWDMRIRAAEMGAWLRPFGHIIYLMPPFTMPESDIAFLADVIGKLLQR